ncbi:MAG: hypothetical protein WCW78_03480 [Candidatus Paceibacterota bacterium]|jgi:hypothetical protein
METHKTKLPPEIVSLIHHIELNQAGWWEEALKKFILASLLILDTPATEEDILIFFSSEFNIELPKNKINDQLKILSSGTLIFIESTRKYKLSEDYKKKIKEEVQISITEDKKAEECFKEILLKNCIDLDATLVWSSFNEKLLLPFIKDAGASVYSTVTENQNIGIENVEEFLSNYPIDARLGLRKAIREFLNLGNEIVRNYVLRYLNAFFFVEASGIKEDNLNKINSIIKSKPNLVIFLDTNFIFSLLGLRDVEANAAGDSFFSLVKSISDRVSVKLYVLNTTFDETKHALSLISERLGELHLSPNLAGAAIDLNLGDFTNKLAIESQKAGKPISPRAYLAPYQSNLLTILRGKGIELHNPNLKEIEESEEVLKDIKDAMRFDRGIMHPKKSDQWINDIVLWHFVKKMRPHIIESPLDAKNWILTIDHRFLSFDSRKQRMQKDPYPICLLPISFIKLLQFWVPRNPQIEDALFRNVRLPMLFPSFDPRSESAALKILETLSRYEHVQDLPKETVTALLMNTALQQNLFDERDEIKRTEYIREALVDEHARVAKRLGEERQKRKIAEIDARESKAEIKNQKENVAREKLCREEMESDLKGQLDGIKRTMGEKQLLETQKKIVSDFYKNNIVVPISLGFFIVLFFAFLIKSFGGNLWLCPIGALVFIPIVMKIKKIGENNPLINIRSWFISFTKFFSWIVGIISLVGVALLGEIVRYWFNQIFP